MIPYDIIICFFLVGISAFLASTEVAVFSLSRFQLRYLKKHFPKSHKRIRSLLSDPNGLLTTILISNEMVNIALSTIITHQVITHWPFEESVWLQTLAGTLITMPLFLIFCEITPKVIGSQLNQLLALTNSAPLLIIYKLFKPVRKVVELFLKFLSRILSPMSKTQKATPLTHPPGGLSRLKEDEFLLMVEEGEKEGMVDPNEADLIKKVFELDNTRISKIYTPMSKVYCIPNTLRVKDAIHILKRRRYYRVPVFNTKSKTREIIGILYAKDLIQFQLSPDKPESTISDIMREPYMVSKDMKLNSLFRKFKKNKSHMAIVKDDNEHHLGIVTMTDVLDVIFEDVFPEMKVTDHVS